MRRMMAVVGLVVLVGCGGGGDDKAEAFCNDLRDGMTPMQILSGSEYTGQTAADRAYAWAATDCPDQLSGNEALRSYLENWGINPDA